MKKSKKSIEMQRVSTLLEATEHVISLVLSMMEESDYYDDGRYSKLTKVHQDLIIVINSKNIN